MKRSARGFANRVASGGPDAVHLCLTVGEVPHLWGCAWASYGEAVRAVPRSRARREAASRVVRARLLPAPAHPAPNAGQAVGRSGRDRA